MCKQYNYSAVYQQRGSGVRFVVLALFSTVIHSIFEADDTDIVSAGFGSVITEAGHWSFTRGQWPTSKQGHKQRDQYQNN